MKITRASKPDPAPIVALAASLRAWLVGLAGWMAETLEAYPRESCPGWLRPARDRACRYAARALRDAAGDLRMLVLAGAYFRTDVSVRRAHAQTHSSAPCGFRRSRRQSAALRRALGGTLSGLHTGSLRQRAARLQRLLTDLEPLIARVSRRVTRLLCVRRGPGLVLIAACDAVRTLACPAPAPADTS